MENNAESHEKSSVARMQVWTHVRTLMHNVV